ncbi:MAG: hypothetical protein E4G98_00470 [Promethearchaeota archaeon]|nr:MAG: hypothetical protein E4G98_00470 [Candidatus Lokiarchaeota archaeon]
MQTAIIKKTTETPETSETTDRKFLDTKAQLNEKTIRVVSQVDMKILESFPIREYNSIKLKTEKPTNTMDTRIIDRVFFLSMVNSGFQKFFVTIFTS